MCIRDRPDAAGTRFELAFLHTFAPGLMVNDSGLEFGEGSLSHAFMGKAICNPENGGRFYHVTDRAGAIRLAKNDSWGACTDYDCLADRGDIVHFDKMCIRDRPYPALPRLPHKQGCRPFLRTTGRAFCNRNPLLLHHRRVGLDVL